MKKIVSAALLATAISTPAFAADASNYYISADFGSASYSNVTVAAGTYPNPGMFRIAAGYQFSPTLGAEIGYTKFGDSSIIIGTASGTIVASSFQVAAVGTFPITPEFNLIAKAGLASNKQSLDVKSSGIVTSSYAGSQSALMVNLGAQYNFSPKFGLRVQYENYGEFGPFGTTGKNMKASTTSFGIVSYF
ncbi:MAG: porin family protein [Pseudomonadota bacterium]